MESSKISTSDIIKTLKSNLKKILGYSLLTSIIVAGLSLLLPDYYKSNVIFYVNNTKNLDPKIIFGELAPDFFGSDEEIQRIKLLSTSKEFQNHMINEFNLIDYFEIDTSSVKKRASIYKKIKSIIKLTKDESETLILEVEHKNPKTAAIMANSAVDYLESMNSKIISNYLQGQKLIFTSQIKEKEKELIEISDTLNSIKKEHYITVKNIDAEKQTIGYTSSSENHQEEFNLGIDKFLVNRENYLTISENKNIIESLKMQYNTILNSLQNKSLKTLTIVEAAYPNFVKDNPKRSFIVIGVFIFSILTFTLVFASNSSKD